MWFASNDDWHGPPAQLGFRRGVGLRVLGVEVKFPLRVQVPK